MTSAVKRSALHTMSRRGRCALVLAMQFGMVAFAVTFAFAPATGLWWLGALALCLEALYLSLFFLFLRPIMTEVANKKASNLDERQLSVRDRAHFRAYQILYY